MTTMPFFADHSLMTAQFPKADRDPMVAVIRKQDFYEEHMPDVVVVVLAPDPKKAPCWEWDPDWTLEPHWLRAVARLVSGIPDPVGCCCCRDTDAAVVLQPGNVALEDALDRALGVIVGKAEAEAEKLGLTAELYRLVVEKESGKPLSASCVLPSVRVVAAGQADLDGHKLTRLDTVLPWVVSWLQARRGSLVLDGDSDHLSNPVKAPSPIHASPGNEQ